MYNKLKNLIIGSPLNTIQLSEKKLNNFRALAIFSPGGLSSIAYANQEIFLSLAIAGAAGLSLSFPIGLAITGLLVILAISYMQTIKAYPSGGGSYQVARENLGTLAGLVAASALLLDYLLTAAVSITAGVEAIASAFPILWPNRVWIALLLLLVMTIANLRGLQETGTLMSFPVYLFLFSYIPMLLYGFYRLFQTGPQPLIEIHPISTTPITLFLILHAFSTGCTALTGIEAISNGVPAYKEPASKNANRTMGIMTILMAFLFLGSISLTQYNAIIPNSQETILSALARNLFGNSPFYFIIQITTMMILSVAANTSFAGFPRLAAILASDSFLPRQLKQLGDRLVFANGIVLLSIGTAILIIVFHGDTHLLIPLFAVGVFMAFTLSQTGMVIHWFQERSPNWIIKAFANSLGALATAITMFIVGVTKFFDGAWIIILFIILFVSVFRTISNHYEQVNIELSLRGLPPSLKAKSQPRILIPISNVHRGIINAVVYARSISNDISALYIELTPGTSQYVQAQWQEWFPDLPFLSKPSPYRSIIGPLIELMDEEDKNRNDGQLATILLPEFVPARWWQGLLHNQTSWLIKTTLLYRRRYKGYQRAIIDIPFHLRK